MTPARRNHGTTLLELLVVLVVLAVSATVVGLAVTSLSRDDEADAVSREITQLRRAAIREGRSRTRYFEAKQGPEGWVTALPTGAVVSDSVFSISRLTGRKKDAF